jgi:hypothetical protein
MSRWKEIWQSSSYVLIQIQLKSDSFELTGDLVRKGKLQGKPFSAVTIEELVIHFGKYTPMRLHVIGSGVLTRLTDNVQGYKEQLLVNGDKDDFYFTTYHDDTKILVSFFRKNLIETVVHHLLEQKIFLLSITSGIVPIVLCAGKDELITFDYNLQILDGNLVKLERNEKSVERTILSGVFYQYSEILAQSLTLISTQSEANFQQGLSTELTTQNNDEYIQYNQFRFFGVSVVFIILVTLLGNYFYLNYLNQEIADLEVDLTLHNDNLSLLEKLKQEQTRKEMLVENSGVFQKYFLTFYLDKLIGTVPTTISLQESSLFPVKEALKEKQKVEIDNHTLTLIGTTPTSEILEEWMNKMNRFSWVKSVELINYLKENKEASFKLLITFQE